MKNVNYAIDGVTSQLFSILEESFPNKILGVSLSGEIHIENDLGFDSMDIILLFSKIESQFSIDFFEAALSNQDYKLLKNVVKIIQDTFAQCR